MKTTSEQAQMRFGLLRLIAIYKIGKVALFLAAAYGVLRLRDASFLAQVYSWASTLPYGLEQDLVKWLLTRFGGLSPSRIDTLGLGSLAYAVVFAVEGVGLWMRKRWAEWLTAIITGSLVPVEIYELAENPGIGLATVLVLNVLIVWYLIAQIRGAPPHAP